MRACLFLVARAINVLLLENANCWVGVLLKLGGTYAEIGYNCFLYCFSYRNKLAMTNVQLRIKL